MAVTCPHCRNMVTLTIAAVLAMTCTQCYGKWNDLPPRVRHDD